MSYPSKRSGESGTMIDRDGNARALSWCPSMNIYRVNRFNILTNDKTSRKPPDSRWMPKEVKFDIIEDLLMHNLLHVAERIFDYVGFPYTWSCLRVNRLWYEFLAHHIFPRWAANLMKQDASLYDIYAAEELTSLNPGKICWQVHQLKEVWQNQRPKLKRLSCDSFVLSIKVHQEKHLYCGLNNGSLQLWDLNNRSVSGVNDKVYEKEDLHDKGIKSLDASDNYIVTGSYDCTAKIWWKDSLVDITLLHTISLHNDSVWDLRLKGETLVTGGLDGAIGIFNLSNRVLQVRNFFKATDALVAAIDFNDDILITGFEDALIAMWTLNDASELGQVSGHTGGITGIRINGNMFASSSYDGTVCLWTLEGEKISVFTEPNHLLRCIGFSGNTIVAGDFGGYIHFWQIHVGNLNQPTPGCVSITKYHAVPSHKSHIVCLQLNARKLVSGSRDKTVLVQDFWASVSKTRSL